MTPLDPDEEDRLREEHAWRLKVAGMDPESWCEDCGCLLPEVGGCRVCGYERKETDHD